MAFKRRRALKCGEQGRDDNLQRGGFEDLSMASGHALDRQVRRDAGPGVYSAISREIIAGDQ